MLTLRPPKVGPVLGYLRRGPGDGHLQRVFFTIETNFLDSPSRGLVAWSRIDELADREERHWQIRHGIDPRSLAALATMPGLSEHNFDPELWTVSARAPANPQVAAFTVDLPVGANGQWFIVCFSLSLSVAIDGEDDLENRVSPDSAARLDGAVVSGLDNDAGTIPENRLLQLLDELKQQRGPDGTAPALAPDRHEYPDRRVHRGALLSLSQSAGGADLSHLTEVANPAATQAICFAVGACRYPGTEMDRTRRDRMLDVMCNARPAFNLIVGDAIYADAAVDVATQRSDQERWVDRYTSAFMSRGFAGLLASAPTYFLPDDHEFSNDWFAHPDLGRAALKPIERAARNRQNEFAWAFDAQAVFEWWHGPRGGVCATAAPAATAPRSGREILAEAQSGQSGQSGQSDSLARWPATHRWSATRFGGHPFFLMDTRTERARGWKGQRDQIVSDAQMSAVLDWLFEHRRWPGLKFIVCGSPVAPAPRAVMLDHHRGLFDDAWWGFPGQLRELFAMIAMEQIEGVVFIGGDSHLAALATLTLQITGADGRPRPPVDIRSIVSSGLFIPLPGVNARPGDYWPADGRPDGNGREYCYKPACGAVRSSRESINGSTLDCKARIHTLRFEEHCALVRAQPANPAATLSDRSEVSLTARIQWPEVTFLPEPNGQE